MRDRVPVTRETTLKASVTAQGGQAVHVVPTHAGPGSH